MKKVYQGLIEKNDHVEAYNVAFLKGDYEPLAKQIADDISEHGSFLTVRYFISASEKTEEQLIESLIRRISGDSSAEYEDAYSECTGYLWTDENIQVGGHDLLEEIKSNVGKYLFLEIQFSPEPSPTP